MCHNEFLSLLCAITFADLTKDLLENWQITADSSVDGILKEFHTWFDWVEGFNSSSSSAIIVESAKNMVRNQNGLTRNIHLTKSYLVVQSMGFIMTSGFMD
jgi:hypothetical protein